MLIFWVFYCFLLFLFELVLSHLVTGRSDGGQLDMLWEARGADKLLVGVQLRC